MNELAVRSFVCWFLFFPRLSRGLKKACRSVSQRRRGREERRKKRDSKTGQAMRVLATMLSKRANAFHPAWAGRAVASQFVEGTRFFLLFSSLVFTLCFLLHDFLAMCSELEWFSFSLTIYLCLFASSKWVHQLRSSWEKYECKKKKREEKRRASAASREAFTVVSCVSQWNASTRPLGHVLVL